MGKGEPQVVATFLALGELMSLWRFGSLRYLQRQGRCSLSLEQHVAEGGTLDEVMAAAHELSCKALQVTAAIDISPLFIKSRTMSKTHIVILDIFT